MAFVVRARFGLPPDVLLEAADGVSYLNISPDSKCCIRLFKLDLASYEGHESEEKDTNNHIEHLYYKMKKGIRLIRFKRSNRWQYGLWIKK